MKNTLMALGLSIISTTMIGCKPVKILDIKEIKPNETAWVIPLDGKSLAGQQKFNSVEFLNDKKIPSKRIMIDKMERSIGRFYWDIEWIPTAQVITVDRSLVTREWTDDSNTGTNMKKEGIGVVTKDSMQIRVGLTITASIEEEDASKYLYYHGARQLRDVIDQNVRSFAVAELTRQYSDLYLKDAQTNSVQIYNRLFTEAAATFKEKGITIQYLGNAEGLTYSDPTVQTAINKRYIVEQDIKTAKMEQDAQVIRNETKIQAAKASATAATELFNAEKATQLQNTLQIEMLNAQAHLLMASNWNGHLPANILPANSPLLMSLGESKENVTKK